MIARVIRFLIRWTVYALGAATLIASAPIWLPTLLIVVLVDWAFDNQYHQSLKGIIK